MSDYIPGSDEKFHEWVANFYQKVQIGYSRWKVPEPTAILGTLYNTYENAYAVFMDPNRGKQDTRLKNEARNALKKAVRAYVNAYLRYNPLVTEEDKIALGLHIPDTKPTPVPKPATIPELELVLNVIRQVIARFRNQGSTRWAKPRGVHGVELRWALLPSPPVSVDELTNSAFSTKSPYTFVFGEDKRGMSLYICPRWENGKGKKGPWGEIVKAIVP